MQIKVNDVGEFCKLFRMNILKISLSEMEKITGVRVSTLSSFENGRSTNVKHIILYFMLGDETQKQYFRENIPFIL